MSDVVKVESADILILKVEAEATLSQSNIGVNKIPVELFAGETSTGANGVALTVVKLLVPEAGPVPTWLVGITRQ